MFLHSFGYTLKQLFRNKTDLFWCLAFPLLLGTMFHLAFGGLSEADIYSTIPIAVVLSDTEQDTALKETIDTLSEPGENQLLHAVYTTEDTALSMLEQKEITGIIYGGSTASLTISSEMNDSKMEQSILSSFIEQFNLNSAAITSIAKESPEKLPDTLQMLAKETSYTVSGSFAAEESESVGTMSEEVTYFFNLIAMICLYAAMAGSMIAIKSQPNLSSLGMRKGISPMHKLISISGDLCASLLYQYLCAFISLLYFMLVLKVDFGNEFGYIALGTLAGCFTGVTLGFFIGSLGTAGKDTKFGILMAVIMLSCFFSGLMVGNMRMLIESVCPIFNRINPASVISDSFYALAVYPSPSRFWANMVVLLLTSGCFSLGGFVLVRRKKYANL